MTFRCVVPSLALLSSLYSCGDAVHQSDGRVEDSAAGTVALGLGIRVPYRAIAIASAASLTGRVVLPPPGADSIAATLPRQRSCADTSQVLLPPRSAGDGTVANALVWVDGIAAGKPLPEVRRHQVVVENCQMAPRVLAITSGSTVNVLSRDALVHELQFYRENRGSPVARLLTVDDGQVIPTEQIAAESGIVETRCTKHPWLRAYIAVFDHPYFAITDSTGAFRIDSLPAGTYTVKVWREGLPEPVQQRVVVRPGGAGQLDVRLGSG